MNLFAKLFGRSGAAGKAEAAAVTRPSPPVAVVTPGPEVSPREAARIRTENVRAWCDRLETEADRTGNPRLRQQARNIRARLGMA